MLMLGFILFFLILNLSINRLSPILVVVVSIRHSKFMLVIKVLNCFIMNEGHL